MAFKPVPFHDESYELLSGRHESQSSVAPLTFAPPGRGPDADVVTPPRYGLYKFFQHTPSVTASLVAGVAFSLACFAFTFWLAKQIFECAPWAIQCELQSSAVWMFAHLGQVQGVVSAIYQVSISMIAYATYQLAETTLWPTLTQSAYRLQEIERFIETTRGSLPSSPLALWRARGLQQFTVVFSVTLIIGLLQIISIIVGHAYTIVQLPTTMYSLHATGGGFGLGFTQYTPGPAMMPAAVGAAYGVYTSWANAASVEPLPEYRDFIADRFNISSIGNFTVNAVEIKKHINCSAMPIDIYDDVDYSADSMNAEAFTIATNLSGYGQEAIYVRFMPKMSVWVDNYTVLADNRAVSRLMFAAINGTIEGGHWMEATEGMKDWWASPPNSPFQGISSLACDVDVELVDSSFCRGTDEQCAKLPKNVTLSSTSVLAKKGSDAVSAVWMATIPSCFGATIDGTQSMFTPGPSLENSSLILPTGFTTGISGLDVNHDNWDQATLVNFINVSIGALGMVLTRSWSSANLTVVSELATPRLAVDRTYILLIPIGIAMGSVLLLALLTEWMHKSTGVPAIRGAAVWEILRGGQTPDMQQAVAAHNKDQQHVRAALSEVAVKYGVLADRNDGLGRPENVFAFNQGAVI